MLCQQITDIYVCECLFDELMKSSSFGLTGEDVMKKLLGH